MPKQALVERIIAIIGQELRNASQAALESAQEATDEEARPESKYDTRALETSYLASAQASYAKDLQDALQAYRNLILSPSTSNDPAAIGSLITTLGPSGREQFFIGPARGGLQVEGETGAITILTPKSPLGSQFLGKTIGQAAGPYQILRID